MRIWLKEGEKIYINGAVLRVDRKVSLEFLNDATFFLEAHVMQEEEATTPLRQVYFLLQTVLMDPESERATLRLFKNMLSLMEHTLGESEIRFGLQEVEALIDAERYFEALKRVRALFPLEDDLSKKMEGEIPVSSGGEVFIALEEEVLPTPPTLHPQLSHLEAE